MDPDLQIILDNLANIGAYANEFPEPRTEKEQYLINLVNDLCMWLIEVVEEMDDDDGD